MEKKKLQIHAKSTYFSVKPSVRFEFFTSQKVGMKTFTTIRYQVYVTGTTLLQNVHM